MSSFDELVYDYVKTIPAGKVSTYKLVAEAIGHPGAVRRVGTSLKNNPTPIIVPCHRVVYSNGKVGYYFGEKDSQDKIKLLSEEGIEIKNGKIIDFNKVMKVDKI